MGTMTHLSRRAVHPLLRKRKNQDVLLHLEGDVSKGVNPLYQRGRVGVIALSHRQEGKKG